MQTQCDRKNEWKDLYVKMREIGVNVIGLFDTCNTILICNFL